MRETFTSGSPRGEWATHTGSPSLLLYRHFSRIDKVVNPIAFRVAESCRMRTTRSQFAGPPLAVCRI
jgi:hypothetical protein